MYFLEVTRNAEGRAIAAVLHDWTKAEAKHWHGDHAGDESRSLKHVSAHQAHDWVRSGRLHTTPLYRDGHRIRRASPGI